jgi:CelD/BcsL family acetyltransferase involved in cellulose biosynthesis
MRAVGTELVSPQTFHRSSDLMPLADEWRDLASHVDDGSFFSSPDWCIAWWEACAPSSEGDVAFWRSRQGQLIGVAGLVRADERLHPRLPVRADTWVNLGSGLGGADHCSWPVLPEAVPEVRSWLEGRASSRSVVLRNLDRELSGALLPSGARRIESTICPRVSTPEIGQELSASSRLRKHLRQYSRRLEDRGVAFRWVGPAEVDPRLLDLLFELHGKRRTMKGDSSSFGPHVKPLHERLISLAGPGHGPAFVLAEVAGTVVGMLYGFIWRDTFAYFQTGWEPAWSKESLGTALVAEALQFSARAGAKVFDFLRGAEEYKYRFGAVDRVDESWLLPRGFHGRALSLKYRLKERRNSSRLGPAHQLSDDRVRI